MTTAFAVKTFFEIAAVLMVVLGILNEDKLIAFEQSITRIVKRKIRMYRRRKAIEKRHAQGTHLKVASDRKNAPVRRQSVA